MASPVLDLEGPHGRIIGSGPARYMQIIDGVRCYFDVHKQHLPDLDVPFEKAAKPAAEPPKRRRRKAAAVVDPAEETTSREPTFVEPEI